MLIDAVIMLVESMHPSHVNRLASIIRDQDVEKEAFLHEQIGFAQEEILRLLLERWKVSDVTQQELAGMLIGASRAYYVERSRESIDLVWTGPSTEMVATRRTEQVLLEVIGAARSTLFLSSFVVTRVESIIDALSSAVNRRVDVSILLESNNSYGNHPSQDHIVFMNDALPKATIYVWKKKDDGFVNGKVHAKLAVADGSICFITSANLTGHAMEKNMECGVLIRGGDIPDRLNRHLNALVKTRIITPISQ